MNANLPRRVRGSIPGAVVGVFLAWSIARALSSGGAIANPAGWPMVRAFAVAALQPDLSPALLRLTLVSTSITLAFAAAGTALALLVGTVGGVLASNIWWGEHQSVASVFRVLLALPRSLHEVVWGLLLVGCLGLTPLTAILALGIHYGAVTARVTAETLDDVPAATFHALRNAGASRLVALCYGLIPPAAPDLISYGFYRFECAIRASIVLGMIGAGGLGFQVLLSMQSLRYGEVWTFLYALTVLCGLTDAWSSAVRRRRLRTAPVAVALALWSIWYLRVDLGRLASPRPYELLAETVRRAFPPRIPAHLGGLTLDTLAMSILAITMAFAFALPTAIPAAKGRLASRLTARFVLLVARAVSAPVWTLIALFVLFPGTLPGAVGLALFNFGVLGRLLADSIEDLDPTPISALERLGARPLSVVLYGVLPALKPRAITLAAYRWEECVRGTILVGLVGAGGLGTLLTQELGSFDYRGAIVTLGAFVAITVLAEWMIRLLRRLASTTRAYPRRLTSPKGRGYIMTWFPIARRIPGQSKTTSRPYTS
jgi:phosphonate transport system permease protein